MFRKLCCFLVMFRRLRCIIAGSLACSLALAVHFTWRGALVVDEKYLAMASDSMGALLGEERMDQMFFGGPVQQNCTIFTLWEYPKGVPLFIRLNVESWRRHSQGLCKIVKINDSNVKKYIPDMGPEYFRMPTVAAKSDVVRYALIFHHGGMYLDSDFLVVKSLEPIVSKLGQYDFIGYESGRQSCTNGSFSSNFIGGRRGSRFHKAMWQAQKDTIKIPCAHQIFGNPDDRACCPRKKKLLCNVPWASLGEKITWPAADKLLLSPQRPKPRMFCFGYNESFAPNRLAIVFKQRMDLPTALKYWKKHGIQRPFDRRMYHLFNAMNAWGRKNLTEMFDANTVIGEFYRRSFGDAATAWKLLETSPE